MIIDLAPETEKQFSDLIAQGADPDAIVRSAIERYRQSEDAFAAEVQKGLDDLEAGRFTTLKDEADLDAFMQASEDRTLRALDQAGTPSA